MRRHQTILSRLALLAARAAIVLLTALVPHANAGLPAYDGFNGTTGDINNQGGGTGWGTVWYTCGGTSATEQSPDMTYSANNLTASVVGNYLHSAGASVGFRRLDQYYGNSCAQGGSSIWISFLGRATFCNNNGFFGLSLFDSPGGDGCNSAEKFFIGKRGGSNCSTAGWGMQRSGGPSADTGVAFDGTTHLVVVRIDFPGNNNNSALMWIDPPMTSTPSDASAKALLTSMADMCWDRVRVTSSAASFGNDAAGDIDELHFGTTFCSVISVVNPTVGISANTGNTICAGTSVTFTATPSNAGNSPTYQWKKGSGTVGSNGSTYTDTGLVNGDSITCTVTSSGCGSAQATSSAIVMTVNQKSADPTSATASVNPICNGGSTALSLTGGGGGTGETIHWYSGSCGGTSVGTGDSLSVSPTTTTTYYGRYEDGSPCSYNSTCASVTVTVNPVPGAPSPPVSYAVAPNFSLKINISALLAQWTGTGLSVQSAVTPSTQGGTVSKDPTYIYYVPPSGTLSSDSISYTVSGANSCTTTASIGISFVKQGGVAQNITYASGGTVTINFAGIPTYQYDVQRCPDANFSSGNVTTVLTTNAPTAGVFSVTDTPPGTSAYYRLMQH